MDALLKAISSTPLLPASFGSNLGSKPNSQKQTRIIKSLYGGPG
jgi:hypothetical protein